jgi:hypothetical protein
MAFNGSGLFVIDSTGQPVSANTLIESADFNALTADLATGLSNCITKDGQQTVTANLPMATYRHTGVGNAVARTDYAAAGQVQDGKLNWVDGGGTADAITATYSPSITALVDGQLCCVRATAANATTTPTFSPNGLTARTIVKKGGSALVVGDIVGDGHELQLRYDLTNTRWELLNPGAYAASGAATASGLTMATSRLLGRTTASTGAIEEVTVGNGLSLTGTNLAVSGGVVQRVEATPFTTYSSDSSGSLPIDDTIPQKTEGNAYVSVSITPKSSTNRLVIKGIAHIGGNGADTVCVTLVDTAINDCLAAVVTTLGGANYHASVPIEHELEAGSTSARTYQLRIGAGAGKTFFVNGGTSTRLFGGKMGCRLWVEEIAV